MNKITIKGRVESLGKTQLCGAKQWPKREVVVETGVSVNGQPAYPNPLPIVFKKDKVGLTEGMRVGEEIEADVTLDGRRWDGPNGARWFVDITAWAVRRLTAAENAQPPAEQETAVTTEAELPF